MAAGDKNAYWCGTCKGYIVTIDRIDGVTPMFLACRVGGEPGTHECTGRMESMMYPEEPWPVADGFGNPIPTVPTWEWYTPDAAELKRMHKRVRQGREDASGLDHVERGGLLLRKIG